MTENASVIADRIVEGLTPKVHKFSESFKRSEESSKVLDDYFGNNFNISHVRKILDLHGVDRIFESKKTGNRFSVEYKADYASARTGSCFFETTVQGQRGWFYTSLCQILVIHIPDLKEVLWFDFIKLKRTLQKNLSSYKLANVSNETYKAKGILVPREQVRTLSTVFNLP